MSSYLQSRRTSHSSLQPEYKIYIDMDENLEYWLECIEENDYDVCNKAQITLLDICHNILKSPDNDKFREVRLDNEIIIQKILPAIGAMECLIEVGYVEDGERLFFPHNTSLSKIQCLSQMLSIRLQKSATKNKVVINNKKFFKQILHHFDKVMIYEDKELQKEVIKLIPIDLLETKSTETFRELQRSYKTHNSGRTSISDIEEDLSLQDFLLITFTSWFKQDFFKWVNNPMCPVCSIECVYENTVHTSDSYCSRIEMYRCINCNKSVKFPRYTHPKPLLKTRCGRCGEWANVFTLMCRSLQYDARLIRDETDHVWTEVWSSTRKKWIHVDPCENVVDKPLMYEKGWKKNLSYIFAYSKDEVQDVTWRYTQDPEAVLKRRTSCTEQSLTKLIRFLSDKRQNTVGYSAARRKYVINRTLCELTSMIYVPNSQNQDSEKIYQGRTSGSLAWRLARGESTFMDEGNQDKHIEKNYIWDISKYEQTFQLQYNIVKDLYQVIHNGTSVEQINGWSEGINSTCGGIFRKREDDWKMIYLARSQGAEHGHVTWVFKIVDPQLCVETFNLKAKTEVFHGARVLWEIEAVFNDKKSVIIPITQCDNFHTKEVEKAVRLNLNVVLSGGKNDNAWQHAQLFRQTLKDTEEPSMIITIQLKNQCV